MPPAAVGAAFAAVGIGTASTVASIVTAVYTTAVVGAVVGAATAAIQGGDILKGALKGAVGGAIAGGVGKTAALALGVGKAGVDAVNAKQENPTINAGINDADYVKSLYDQETTPTGVKDIAAGLRNESVQAPTTEEPGLLGGLTKWIDQSPKSADILAQGLGGAAKGLLDSNSEKEKLEYRMERDRLDRQPRVTGLQNLGTGPSAIPSISGFTKRPTWLLDDENNGLLPVRVGG